MRLVTASQHHATSFIIYINTGNEVSSLLDDVKPSGKSGLQPHQEIVTRPRVYFQQRIVVIFVFLYLLNVIDAVFFVQGLIICSGLNV